MNKALLVKILTIGLYVAPLTIFLFVQKTLYPMVTLKFISLYIVIELLFLVWLALVLWHPEFRPRKSWVFASVILLLTVLTITSMLGINPHRSFWSTPDRMSGLYTLWHFFAYFLMLYSLRRQLDWQKYFRALFLISLVVALFVLVQKVFPGFFLSGEASRPGSFMGNPALLAGYLIFNIFLGGWLALESKESKESKGYWRWIYGLGACYEAWAIFLGSTRGAMLGLIAGVLILLVMLAWPKLKEFKINKSVVKNPAVLVLVGLVLFGIIFTATRSAELWQKVPGLDRLARISLSDGAVNNRLIAWGIAFKSFQEKPVLGSGWENFKYSFDSKYDPRLFRNGYSETFWDRPHNVFLEYLTNSGLPGLLAYLGVFAAAFYVIIKKTSKQFRPFGIALLAAYLVQNTVVFDSYGTYLMLFALLAFLAHQEGEPADSTKSTHQFARYGIFIAGAALVLTALVINVKIVYANNLEYWGINYLSQKIALEGIKSFKEAVSVSQPYVNDIRLKQMQMITRANAVVEIPNLKENVKFALAELKKAQATDPFNYYLYYTEADSKVVFRDITIQFYRDAQLAIRKAEQLSPNRQQNMYVAAKIKYLFGDAAGSVRTIEQAVNLDPESADPHYYYGLLLWNSNNQQKAVSEFKRAAELGYRPKDAIEAKQLGDIYGDADEYQKSIAFYQQALTYDKSDIDATLKIGLVYMFMGETDNAKPYFKRVLELFPDFKSSQSYEQFRPYFESAGI